MNGFQKSLEELVRLADCFKLREKELEQQHKLELEKQAAECHAQVQVEKKRVEQLQEINRTLTEQIEHGTEKQIDFDQKYTVLIAKYNCSLEELKHTKERLHDKTLRIEELERIASILKNDKIRADHDMKQLRGENASLQDKIKERGPLTTTASTPHVSEELIPLIEKAVAENGELKNALTERDSEIQRLKDDLTRGHSEDPQLVEQRLLHLIGRLKGDFRTMYEHQSTFFLEKIDLLKQEQRENIASLYKH